MEGHDESDIHGDGTVRSKLWDAAVLAFLGVIALAIGAYRWFK